MTVRHSDSSQCIGDVEFCPALEGRRNLMNFHEINSFVILMNDDVPTLAHALAIDGSAPLGHMLHQELGPVFLVLEGEVTDAASGMRSHGRGMFVVRVEHAPPASSHRFHNHRFDSCKLL